MNDTIPLPDLQQEELDEATVRQLFDDISTHAELIDIIPKQSAQGYVAENASLTLTGALDLLLHQSVRALQLRYAYQQAIWWDTLTPIAGGRFRIIRIQHQQP